MVWRNMIMSEYTILPLINAAFQPGEAKKMVDSFEDRDFQEIARAEYYYLPGRRRSAII